MINVLVEADCDWKKADFEQQGTLLDGMSERVCVRRVVQRMWNLYSLGIYGVKKFRNVTLYLKSIM